MEKIRKKMKLIQQKKRKKNHPRLVSNENKYFSNQKESLNVSGERPHFIKSVEIEFENCEIEKERKRDTHRTR